MHETGDRASRDPAVDATPLKAPEPEVSLVLETYNYGEGSTPARLRRALHAATDMAARHGETEVLLADSVSDSVVRDILGREFPHVRHVDASGLDYDEAKLKAVSVARGRYVLFMDGDCVPVSPD